MLERLDSPSQATFTSIEGREPYFHKWTKPISRIRYADSVFNVRSNGIKATWYTSSRGMDNDRSTAYVGYIPIVKNWYGGGQPEVFVNETLSEWAVKYEGWFYSPITADYTFSFAGEGQVVDFTLATAARIDVGSPRSFMGINQNDYASTQPFTLSGGEWSTYTLKYKKRVSDQNAGFITMWQTDSASVTPDKIVLSAGVTTPTQPLNTDTPFPVAWESLTGYNNTNLNIQKGRGSTFKFEVPFISTASYNYNGFRFVGTDESYQKLNSSFALKKYRMVEFSEGYQNVGGTDEFITKFTGQIRDFNIKYGKRGNDKLEVICQDYSAFTKDAINLTAPTPIDYWEAGYIDNIPRHVNGQSKPRTFDGWEIHKAYQIMLTQSFVDPYSFFKREIRNDIGDNAVAGGFYVSPISSSVKSFLPIQNNYGNENIIIDPEAEPDDEYLYKIATGEHYQDAIDSIMNTWQYNWGFNRYGHPFLRRNEVPIQWITHNDFDWDVSEGSGLTTGLLDLESFKGSYSTSNVVSISSARFTGTRADVLLIAGLNFGSSDPDTKTIQVQIKDANYNVLQTTNINTYNSKDWFYYSGADPDIGTNPTSFQVADNLNYDEYICFVNNTDGLFQLGLNALLVYGQDINRPSEYLYTGDVNTSGSIGNLTVKSPTKDQRTEAIVLGALQGTNISNDNNPTLNYIQASARDLNSVYKSTALNYVGRPRTVLIQNPKINSQDQANYVAFNTMEQLSNPHQPVELVIAGHPKLEIDDLIVVTDDFKLAVDTNNFAWVTGINNIFNGKNYTTKITTSSYKPVPSFWEKVEPSSDDYPNPIINFQLKNQGASLDSNTAAVSLTSDMNVDSSTAWVSTNVSWLPDRGYFELYQLYSQSGDFNGPWELISERCKYDRVYDNGSGKYALASVTRDLRGDSARTWVANASDADVLQNAGTYVNMGWDPYTSERMGINPYMTFDLARNGSIKVHVKSHVTSNKIGAISRGVIVDTLTNVEEDNPSLAFDEVQWGKNKKYIWGGWDRYGEFNNSIPTDAKLQFGTYVRDSHIHNKVVYSNPNRPYKILSNSNMFRNYRPLHKDINPEFRPAGYSKFYIEIDFIPEDPTQPRSVLRTIDSTASSFKNRDNLNNMFFTTHLGDVPTLDMWISTAGAIRWNHNTQAMDQYVSSIPHVNRKGPSRSSTSGAHANVDPVYIEASANENKGLEFFVQQVDTALDRDSDSFRECSLQAMNAKIRSFYISTNTRGTGGPIDWRTNMTDNSYNLKENVSGASENDYKIYSTPKALYFNMNAINDPEFSALPKNIAEAFESYKVQYANDTPKLWWYSIIYFVGDIVDKSGRAVKDSRDFIIKKDPNIAPIGLYDVAGSQYRLEGFNYASDHTYLTKAQSISSALFGFDTKQKVDSKYWNHGWYSVDEPQLTQTLAWKWQQTLTCDDNPESGTISIRPGLMGDEAQHFYGKHNVGVTSTAGNMQHFLKLNYIYWLDSKLIKTPYTQFERNGDINIQQALPFTDVRSLAGEYSRNQINRIMKQSFGENYIYPAAFFVMRGY